MDNYKWKGMLVNNMETITFVKLLTKSDRQFYGSGVEKCVETSPCQVAGLFSVFNLSDYLRHETGYFEALVREGPLLKIIRSSELILAKLVLQNFFYIRSQLTMSWFYPIRLNLFTAEF